jgi:hypothetical protein
MRHRIARTVFPCGLSSDPVVVVSTWRVPVPAARPSIYHTVDFVERLLFRGRCGSLKRIEERIPLRSIIALHNVDGIRDVAQIKAMLRQIRAGGDVLHSTGLPNVKLVSTVDGEWVLFDGHHTMLAYMGAGKDYLDEIPHLIVHNGCGCVSDGEILVFFGTHSRELTASTWRAHAINWQAPHGSQLCKRVQDNMGELFESLSEQGFWTDAALSGPALSLPPRRNSDARQVQRSAPLPGPSPGAMRLP